MSSNVISFIKRALQGGTGAAVPVADDQPLPVTDAGIGATTDAAETVSSNDASVIALLKGLLSGLGATTSAKIQDGDTTGTLIAHIKGINEAANDTTAVNVNKQASASGSLTKSKTLLTASTNATSVKASAGQVYKITGYNPNDEVIYLKFHDSAAAPTPGTTAVVWVEAIPVAGRIDVTFAEGLPFTSGIAFSVVEGLADNDATSIDAAALVCIEYV